MLLRYNVENFKSFARLAELSMFAGKAEALPDQLIDFKKAKILKSAIIYGANASGKSNLIDSIEFAQKVVLKGLKDVYSHDLFFKIDTDFIKKPSRFSFEIKCGENLYSYGFSVILNEKKIIGEWLYKITPTTEKKIFDREEKVMFSPEIVKSKTVGERFKIYGEDILKMPTQLFLTEIIEKNLTAKEAEPFKAVHNWFKTKLTVITPDSKYSGINFIGDDENIKKTFEKFLNLFDTGITQIETKDEDAKTFFEKLDDEIKNDIQNDLNNSLSNDMAIQLQSGNKMHTIVKDNDIIKVKKLVTRHGANSPIFEIDNESDGTIRLFDLIPILHNLQNDSVFVIDELDRSLHSNLTKTFVKCFLEAAKTNESQLITTTHDTNLLDLNILRRDSFWFVDRDKDYISDIYSLDKFKVRTDKDIKKDYLAGRYGGIPVLTADGE